MSLIEYDLLKGKVDKIKVALDRLDYFKPQEGYELAYSGGKDSDVILELIKMSGIKYRAVHNLTTIDPPEVIYHIKNQDIEISHPKKPLLVRMVEKGCPPTRKILWCCDEYKERGDHNKFVILGIRRAESRSRKQRPMFQHCQIKTRYGKQLNPIISMSEKVRKKKEYLKEAETISMTADPEIFVSKALKEFENAENNFDIRILSYRNIIVESYNNRIRNHLYGNDVSRFVKGEWLMAKETWSIDKMPIIMNSEEVEVLEAEERTIDTRDEKWKIWDLYVANNLSKKRLYILHEEEFERYENTIEDYKKKAMSGIKFYWAKYYSLIEGFARVDYAYAMTVHKSQGSTFKKVFVDHRDLNLCKEKERQKLIYVAVTRPSEELNILI